MENKKMGEKFEDRGTNMLEEEVKIFNRHFYNSMQFVNYFANKLINKEGEISETLLNTLDDAFDDICCYIFKNLYGLNITPNPNGDRSSIKVDDTIMSFDSFNDLLDELDEYEYDEDAIEDEEDYLVIDDEDEDEEIDEEEIEDEEDELSSNCANEKTLDLTAELPDTTYLNLTYKDEMTEKDIRRIIVLKYKHWLAKGCKITIDKIATGLVKISNISWGRKLSKNELEKLNS